MNQEEIPLSVARDTEWNRYISLPFRPVQLPDWKECESVAPCVLVKLGHIQEVLNAYREKNTARVNEILSTYY